MQWETVIGLEVHVQLATRSKLFTGAGTEFGAEPNTQTSAPDLAMPGTLPMLNEEALRQAVMFGLAIQGTINQRSIFERKNYFYPDLPSGYQLSQMSEPIVGPGIVEIEDAQGERKVVRIHHAHLEVDAGKSVHEDLHGHTGIDLNRAGMPLIEIVTEPDMRSAEEAVAVARKLHAIVTSLGICDGDMSQGSMRFDVNVSVRPVGQDALGTRTETKNLNSFRFMEDAIRLEAQRQIELLEDGGTVVQETRLYNGETRISRSMRTKEEATDYRYFPCPDLLPVCIDSAYIDAIRDTLPELPDARRERFTEQYGLSAYDAAVIGDDAGMAHYFETAAAACDDPKLAANWIMGDLSARLNSDNLSITQCPVDPRQLALLVLRIKDNTLSSKLAKQVFDAMWAGEGDPDAIIEARGLKQVSDSSALEALVDDAIAANPAQVEQYRAADPARRKKLIGFFVGHIMKASKGQANPALVNQLLASKLDP